MNIKNLSKKQIITIIIIIVLIPLLAILLVNIFYNGSNSYSKLETQLVNAAKNYYQEYANQLPLELGKSLTIQSTELTSKGYLKSINKLSPKGTTCQGKVILSNPNGTPHYNAYLDCGEDYQTTTLVNYILNNETIVTDTDGLYKIDNQYIYKGEFPNNYIKFNNKTYRILNIDENNKITIIATSSNNRYVWDDRYNNDKNQEVGINNYNISRLKTSLTEFLETNISENDKSKLEYQNICIGKTNINAQFSQEKECATTLTNQLISLATISQFAQASLDSTCQKASNQSCQNYNYLSKFDQDWWTITANELNTYEAFAIEGKGSVTVKKTSSSAYIREVFKLTDNLIYISGNGTKDNPYTFK